MTRNRLVVATPLLLAASQSVAVTQAPAISLEQEIANRDAEFFGSFNRCDKAGELEKHAAFLDPKLEFYHDLGGVSWTAEAYLDGVRRNVCGKFARELVPGTMKVFPLKDFGALSTGVHRFCHFDTGRCEGEADFAIVWRLNEDRKSWTITRVLSYGHHELPERPKPLASTVQSEVAP